MEESIARYPVEYWDGLQTKEELYEKIDNAKGGDRGLILGGNAANLAQYCDDTKFKELGERLEKAAQPLREVLNEVATVLRGNEKLKRDAERELEHLNLNNNFEIAKLAYFILFAFDNTDGRSFIKRVEAGNGIPEERAAIRAGKRYTALKKQDAEKLAAFKRTPEYELQAAELKFKVREKIEVPEE